VRQAVQILLRFPQIIQRITTADIDALDNVDARGMDVLRELPARLKEHPAASTAQVLERWRGTRNSRPVRRHAVCSRRSAPRA
jgi:hypothetical protein